MSWSNYFRKFRINFIDVLEATGWRVSRIGNVQKYIPDLYSEISAIISNRHPLILDVGANTGQTTEKFLNLFPNASVVAIEPNSDLHSSFLERARQATANQSRYRLLSYGLSSQCGEKEFYLSANSGHSSFHLFNRESRWLKIKSKDLGIVPDQYSIGSRSVLTRTLDCLCNELGIGFIDVLKIDTQGHEAEILEGAKEMIQKKAIGLILVGIIHSQIYSESLNYSSLERHLIPNGYRLGVVSRGGSILTNLNFQQDLIYLSPKLLQNLEYTFTNEEEL